MTNVGNVLDFTYGFNAGTANNGNVASIANNRNTARSLTYTYDELNRIDLAYTQATSGTTCWGLDHNYDIWGNLLSITQKPTHNCTSTTLGVGVNTKNQISDTGFVYDAAGNLTNTPNPGGLVMQYDAENRMTSVASTAYKYDGDGRRLWKAPASQPTQPNKLYWYGTGSDPLDETDGAGNTNNASFSEYIFFGGKRIAKRDSSSTINYYFADQLGTSRVVTNATGTILDDSDFYPFGGERATSSSSGNNYKFTGKERDTESGLDFFIARYYSSGYGRFLSPDEFAGGPVDAFSSGDPLPPGPLPYADITNPLSLNKYAYVLNNPLVYVDPEGHSTDLGLGDAARIAACIDLGYCPEEPATAGDGKRKKKDDPDAPVNPLKGNKVGEAVNWWIDGDNLALAAQGFAQAENNWGKAGMGAAFVLIAAIDVIPVGGKAAKGTEKTIAKLTEEAEKLYPKLAGKTQLHHLIPKYLGGALDGATKELPAAYHQLITNATRKLAPYGKKVAVGVKGVKEILKEVYKKLPLP